MSTLNVTRQYLVITCRIAFCPEFVDRMCIYFQSGWIVKAWKVVTSLWSSLTDSGISPSSFIDLLDLFPVQYLYISGLVAGIYSCMLGRDLSSLSLLLLFSPSPSPGLPIIQSGSVLLWFSWTSCWRHWISAWLTRPVLCDTGFIKEPWIKQITRLYLSSGTLLLD